MLMKKKKQKNPGRGGSLEKEGEGGLRNVGEVNGKRGEDGEKA